MMIHGWCMWCSDLAKYGRVVKAALPPEERRGQQRAAVKPAVMKKPAVVRGARKNNSRRTPATLQREDSLVRGGKRKRVM